MPSNCVVLGCKNTFQKAKLEGKQLEFYGFSSLPWKQPQMKMWIAFVKRKNKDGSQWRPTKFSKICSDHFLGGRKSDHPSHPGYIPTVRPLCRPMDASKKLERFKRLMCRRNFVPLTIGSDGFSHEIPEILDRTKTEVQVQTEETFAIDKERGINLLAFIMESMGETKCCQVTTKVSLPETTEFEIQHEPCQVTNQNVQTDRKEFVDVLSGPDNRSSIFCGFDTVKINPELLQDLTGVRSNVFSLLLSLLPPERSQREVSKENRLLIFLMKLKTSLPYTIIGGIFGIRAQTASNIFSIVLSTIFARTADWIVWPTKREIQETMPTCFKVNYPSCRGIIDCSEVKTEKPPGVERQVKLWSNYKNSWTVKFLVCIAPCGLITFVSKAYGGRSSDAYITNRSGILAKFEEGDQIMADKGFPYVQIQNGVTLVMPPFGSKSRQFTTEQMNETFNVANSRIHVERAIGRMKVFSILTHRLPIDLIPHMDEIIHVVAVLTNLSSPIIKQNVNCTL